LNIGSATVFGFARGHNLVLAIFSLSLFPLFPNDACKRVLLRDGTFSGVLSSSGDLAAWAVWGMQVLPPPHAVIGQPMGKHVSRAAELKRCIASATRAFKKAAEEAKGKRGKARANAMAAARQAKKARVASCNARFGK
jgi:hypothetical protein